MSILKTIGRSIAKLVSVNGASGASIPESPFANASQLILPGDSSPYYTEEEWAGYSYRLKDFSSGVGTLRNKRLGYCYDFDGVNDVIRASVANSNNAFTLACYVNPDNLSNDYQTAMALGLSGANYVTLFANRVSSGDYFAAYLQTSTTTTVVVHSTVLPIGQWSHIGVSWDGVRLYLWLNGEVVDSDWCTGTRSFDIVTMGAHAQTTPVSTTYLNGKIYDAWYLDRAANVEELAFMMSGGIDGEEPTGVLLHCPFQEESGIVAYDISGNGNHGTHSGTTPATFHAVDSGVGYSFPNEQGYTPKFIGDGGTTPTVTTYVPNVSNTSVEITFKIKTTDTELLCIWGHTVGYFVFCGQSGSASASTSLSGTPTYWKNGVSLGTLTRDQVYSNYCTGDVIDVKLTNVDISAWTNFRIAGYNATYSFTGELWDLVVDGVAIEAPVKVPAVNETTDALGSPLVNQGRCPNYGLIKDYAWQGDGAAVKVSTGDVAVPASSDFEIRFPIYLFAATLKANPIYFGTGATRVILSDAPNVHRWIINGINTISINTSSVSDGWCDVVLTRVGDVFRLSIERQGVILVSSANTTVGYVFPAGAMTFLWGTDNGYSNVKMGPVTVTTGGITTTYAPIPGTRDIAKFVDGVGSVISSAIVGGTTATLHTLGDGSWRSPAVENGGNLVTQNLLLQTLAFSGWTNAVTTHTTGDIDPPFGSNPPTKVTATAINNYADIRRSITVTNGATYTVSAYLKKGTGTNHFIQVDVGVAVRVAFNVDTGIATASSGVSIDKGMLDVGNGWWRCWFVFTAASTTLTIRLQTTTVVGTTTYWFGAQITDGTGLVPFSPTEASSNAVTELTPAAPGASVAADGSALNVTKWTHPYSLQVDRTGGDISPRDYEIGQDALVDETSNEAVKAATSGKARKRLADEFYSDRYGSDIAALNTSANNTYFGD